MVKIDPNQNHSTNQTTSTTTNQNQSTANQSTNSSSGLMSIIGQLLPLAPFAFEQFTGQKVPQLTGTIAEMQTALLQIQTNLQVIVTNQQQLAQRIINLETSAGNQLTNLTNQFHSLKLTHTKERKEIEYNPNKQLESNEESY